MKLKFLIIFCVLFSAFASAKAPLDDTPDLMPWPQDIQFSQGDIAIKQGLTLKATSNTSDRLTQAMARFDEKINGQLKNHNAKKAELLVEIDVKGDTAKTPVLNVDESYRLSVKKDRVLIRAQTDIGALHGLTTLAQLLGTLENDQFTLPKVEIKDSPRFAWRGLLLDPSRHFLPIEDIKRQVDGMASAKLNVFHWHLTDDQGWRIESNLYPKLHELASDGDYYTQEQMRDVVKYASDRGIRVVPEVDVPGHASAIAVAYPEFMSEKKEYKMERHWGVHEPTLNPLDERVYQFVDGIVKELSAIFPDPYFHIGGDEVEPTQWNKNVEIQTFIKENNLVDYKGMQAFFNQRVNKILQKHNKVMVGWDEIFHPDLPLDVVVQSWRGRDSMNLKAKKGGKTILSTGYYIDQAQPTSYHYRVDPIPEPKSDGVNIAEGDTWQTWSFEMPRLRGSAIKGSFTLIITEQGHKRGFIDFVGRSRQTLSNIHQVGEETWFYVDTWMGRFAPRLKLLGNEFDSEALVANGRYRITGSKIAGSYIENSQLPKGKLLDSLTAQERELVLGGEATLWGENVVPNILDLRVWPRTYAIAERLWSAESVVDPESMYQRMDGVSKWSVDYVGLTHYEQSKQGIVNLFGKKHLESIQILSEAIEQAQYYHRHHAKSVADLYHQDAPLDWFVDTLPVESLANRELKIAIAQWLKHPSKAVYQDIYKKLSLWQKNAEQLKATMDDEATLKGIEPIVNHVEYVATTGLSLLELIREGGKITPEQSQSIKAGLHAAMQIEQEIVVSSAYAVELLYLKASGYDISSIPLD